MATLQLKRKLTGVAAAPPAAAAGELLFSVPGFTGGGPNALYINDGTTAIPLVDNMRQVELAGAQTITGVKMIMGAGAVQFAGVANMLFGDGTAGQLLTKGAGNAIAWAPPALSTVTTDGVTITGNGLAATPIALMPSVFGAGMTFATNVATVNKATAANIAAGTLDTAFATPLGLRSELGAAASTLVTTVKTVVPALNEIYNTIAQLTGVVIYAGTYDATTSTGTYNGQGGIATGTGALPAAAAANHGAYLIVTVAGAGGGTNEPAGPIAVGDWLVSDGTAWARLAFGQAMAAYVAKAGDTMTGALSLPAAVWTTSLTPAQAVNKQWLDWKLDPPDSVILGPTTRLSGGGATGAGGAGGAVTIRGGAGGPGGLGGRIDITSGSSSGPVSSAVLIQAGESTNATVPIAGGDVFIRGGASVSNAASVGGNVILEPGQGSGGAWGDILFQRLKTTAQAADIVWNNNGVLNIGAGGTAAGGITALFFDPVTFAGDALSAATQLTLAATAIIDGGVF